MRSDDSISLLARVAMILVMGLVLTMHLSRFQPPIGEKYLYLMEPGGFDFSFPYHGARNLLQGISPYENEDQYYPPTYYLLSLPLALIFGDNFNGAASAMFYLNLIFFAALAAVTSRVLKEALGRTRDLFPQYTFFLITFSLSFSGYFCLERGQWDAFFSLCCWGAVLASLKRRPAIALGLAMIPALAKGYTALLVIGLALIHWREWRRVLIGALLPILTLLLPVVKYLPIAFERTLLHIGRMDYDWSNTGFANLSRSLVGDNWHDLRHALCLLAFFAVAATFFVAYRAMHDPRGTASSRALWLSAFASAAVGTVTGFNSLSYCFNLLFFFPGLLIWVIAAPIAARELRLSPTMAKALGVAWIPVVACCFKYCLLSHPEVPLAAFGMAGGLAFFAGFATRKVVIGVTLPAGIPERRIQIADRRQSFGRALAFRVLPDA